MSVARKHLKANIPALLWQCCSTSLGPRRLRQQLSTLSYRVSGKIFCHFKQRKCSKVNEQKDILIWLSNYCYAGVALKSPATLWLQARRVRVWTEGQPDAFIDFYSQYWPALIWLVFEERRHKIQRMKDSFFYVACVSWTLASVCLFQIILPAFTVLCVSLSHKGQSTETKQVLSHVRGNI